MVNCDHCGKVFKFDSQLIRHLSSKFPCYSRKPSSYDDIDNEKEKHIVDDKQHIVDTNNQDFVKSNEINVLIRN